MANKKEENWFDKVNHYIDDTEGSVINLLSAIAPWLAPFIPASMSFAHARDVLHFDLFVCWSIAIVVEILGLATVSTWMQFKRHNDRYSKSPEYKKAPLKLVIGMFVFYMITIVSSNVLLDAAIAFAPEHLNAVVILVKALYTLLSVPAALLIAVRQQHRNVLESSGHSSSVLVRTGQNSSGQNQNAYASRSSSVLTTNSTRQPSTMKMRVYEYMDTSYAGGGVGGFIPTYSQVRDTLGLTQNAASRLRNEWLQDNNIQIGEKK